MGVKIISAYKNLNELRSKLQQVCLRIDRSVLDLPPVQHVGRYVQLGTRASSIYARVLQDIRTEIAEGTIQANNSLTRLLRLQQVTSGFAVVEEKQDPQQVDEAKQQALRDIVADLQTDESVIVFCRFRHDLRQVQRVADEFTRPYHEISGARKDSTDRAEMLDTPGQLLGAQIQSGGVGIDLTKARYVVYFSVGYSLGDYEQSVARVHRPGQLHPVVLYHLIAQGTVDEQIYSALRNRRDIVESIVREFQYADGAATGAVYASPVLS